MDVACCDLLARQCLDFELATPVIMKQEPECHQRSLVHYDNKAGSSAGNIEHCITFSSVFKCCCSASPAVVWMH